MKKTLQTILAFSFIFGISPIFAERSKVGFRYPRTFKAYIAEKYKDEKKEYTHNKINQPRFRISAGNIPKEKETNTRTSTTKKFANPAYEKSTRKQVQRAGIFCRFVKKTVPDTDCLRNVQTNTQKKTHYLSTSNRFFGSTQSKNQSKPIEKSTLKKRTFSSRTGFVKR